MKMQIQLKDKLNVIYSQIAKTPNYGNVQHPIRISGLKHFAESLCLVSSVWILDVLPSKKREIGQYMPIPTAALRGKGSVCSLF
jgi:hypothetical protein